MGVYYFTATACYSHIVRTNDVKVEPSLAGWFFISLTISVFSFSPYIYVITNTSVRCAILFYAIYPIHFILISFLAPFIILCPLQVWKPYTLFLQFYYPRNDNEI